MAPRRTLQKTGWGRLIRVSGYCTEAKARKLKTLKAAPLKLIRLKRLQFLCIGKASRVQIFWASRLLLKGYDCVSKEIQHQKSEYHGAHSLWRVEEPIIIVLLKLMMT